MGAERSQGDWLRRMRREMHGWPGDDPAQNDFDSIEAPAPRVWLSLDQDSIIPPAAMLAIGAETYSSGQYASG